MAIRMHSLLVLLIVTVLVTDLPFYCGSSIQFTSVAEAQDPPRRRRRGRPRPAPPPTPVPDKKEEVPEDVQGVPEHTVQRSSERGFRNLSSALTAFEWCC